MADQFCTECGHRVGTDNRFCPECGAPHGSGRQDAGVQKGISRSPTKRPQKGSATCPHCGTLGATRIGAGTVVLASVAAAGCALWIPIIGWAMIPICLLIGVIAAVSAVMPSGKAAFHCGHCRKYFSIPKNTLP